VTPQPPPNWLTISPGSSNPTIPSPGSTQITFTLYNTSAASIFASMEAICSASGVTFVWSGSQTAGILAAQITGANASVSAVQYLLNAFTNADYTPYLLEVSGCVPAGYNGGPWTISANGASSVTAANTADPGPLTTGGAANIVQPGAPVAVTVPPQASVDLDSPPINVAGYGALMNGSGTQFSPAIAPTNSFAGWYIQTTGWAPSSLNQGPTPITAQSNGIFTTGITGSQTTPTTVGNITLTNPNNVTNSPAPYFEVDTPGSATVTLTIVVAANTSTYDVQIQVTASAGDNTAQSIVSLS
jgi:hypothetical protein